MVKSSTKKRGAILSEAERTSRAIRRIARARARKELGIFKRADLLDLLRFVESETRDLATKRG